MSTLTKQEIKKVFIKILEEKPLRKITVRDIVTECGINRNTFYYHFSDIPSLTEAIIIDSVDKIAGEHPKVESIKEILYAVTDFASDNKRLVMHIYQSADRAVFERYLWKVSEYIIAKYGDTVFAGKNVSVFDRKVILYSYQCECFGMVSKWLENNMTEDVKRFIDRYSELHNGIAEEIINRCMIP